MRDRLLHYYSCNVNWLMENLKIIRPYHLYQEEKSTIGNDKTVMYFMTNKTDAYYLNNKTYTIPTLKYEE